MLWSKWSPIWCDNVALNLCSHMVWKYKGYILVLVSQSAPGHRVNHLLRKTFTQCVLYNRQLFIDMVLLFKYRPKFIFVNWSNVYSYEMAKLHFMLFVALFFNWTLFFLFFYFLVFQYNKISLLISRVIIKLGISFFVLSYSPNTFSILKKYVALKRKLIKILICI